MKKFLTFAVLFLAVLGVRAQSPKYIFYFIGDGMGFNQVKYSGGEGINFARFPVITSISTFSASDSVTDSAAAGTALASGRKSSNGTIGMNAGHTLPLFSIAVAARDANYGVAILTSVSIDHATPAAFYAHSPSRSNYADIAAWMPLAGFDIYGGAGLLRPSEALFTSLADSSYAIIRGAEARPKGGQKTLWIQDADANPAEVPYAINRPQGALTLPIMVDASIKALQNSKDGFLIVAEGGKIDWACHANKAPEMQGEVLDLAAAVDYALDFYNKHPLETIVIVTADHETGGLTLPNGEAKWSTGGHSGARVPLYVLGFGAERFVYCKDNTDIVKTLRKMLQ